MKLGGEKMKNDIIQRLIAAINAMNTIPVSGKQNLVNLSGSIAVIEEVIEMLKNAEVSPLNETQ